MTRTWKEHLQPYEAHCHDSVQRRCRALAQYATRLFLVHCTLIRPMSQEVGENRGQFRKEALYSGPSSSRGRLRTVRTGAGTIARTHAQ